MAAETQGLQKTSVLFLELLDEQPREMWLMPDKHWKEENIKCRQGRESRLDMRTTELTQMVHDAS